jgi:hypothetical protein
VRVVAVHRSGLQVAGDGTLETIPPGPEATVGDWLLYDRERPRSSRVLERKSLIKRRAPGTGREVQMIAANIDTVFVVTSCNQDFNVARLERYVALAFEAGIEPVIVLTKADLAEDPAPYVEDARKISDRVPVVALGRPQRRAGGGAGRLVQTGTDGRLPRLVRRWQVDPHQRAPRRAGDRHAGHPRGRREGPAHHDPARASTPPPAAASSSTRRACANCS